MDAVLWILGVLALAVGVGISIGLHELGHLLPARRFGVHIGTFAIGFGPTLWSRRFGETEFALKAIPLGGYVALSGMYPPTATTKRRGFRLFRKLVQDARDASAETIVDESRTFYRLPVWKRVVVMLGGPFANLVIATVLFIAIFSGIGVIGATTTVGSVSSCVKSVTATTDTCASTDPVSPASIAGVRVGDRVVSINGTPVTNWLGGLQIIRASAGNALTLVVERDGQKVLLSVTPVAAERYLVDANGDPVLGADGKPRTATVGYIGFGPTSERQHQPVTDALAAMGSNISQVGGIVLDLPNRMVRVWNSAFGTEARDPNGPVSVVGVGRIAGDIAATNTASLLDRVVALLGIIASLNIALFVFNLIPLLPLDGGHIVVALWEAIRNGFARLRGAVRPGPVDSARLVPITVAVTAVLLAMSALLIYADIVKPITLGS